MISHTEGPDVPHTPTEAPVVESQVTEEYVWNEEDSNLLAHAKRELKAAGYDPNQTEEDPNKWIQENVLELLRVFTKQGHSGMSAPYCIDLFVKLAKYEPLIPLTGEDSEWNEIPINLWQNNRCSRVFKDENGAYDINGKVFVDKNGVGWTNGDSRVPVIFPYTPHTEYVDTPEEPENG